jgi:hypothetical protein
VGKLGDVDEKVKKYIVCYIFKRDCLWPSACFMYDADRRTWTQCNSGREVLKSDWSGGELFNKMV